MGATYAVRDLITSWRNPRPHVIAQAREEHVDDVLEPIQAETLARHPDFAARLAAVWAARAPCSTCGTVRAAFPDRAQRSQWCEPCKRDHRNGNSQRWMRKERKRTIRRAQTAFGHA